MFSFNKNSLGYQSFKWASWVLVSGLYLGDTINSPLLVLGPFLIPMFGLASWAYAAIISNPIKYTCLRISVQVHVLITVSSIFSQG